LNKQNIKYALYFIKYILFELKVEWRKKQDRER